jgi:hypothetical protein
MLILPASHSTIVILRSCVSSVSKDEASGRSLRDFLKMRLWRIAARDEGSRASRSQAWRVTGRDCSG